MKHLNHNRLVLWGRTIPFVTRRETAEQLPADYYAAYRDTYFKLYRLYDILNRNCWNGMLPRTILALDRTETPDGTMARVFPEACRTSHRIMPLIKFHLKHCHELPQAGFAALMQHEMMHIRRHHCGTPPGYRTVLGEEEGKLVFDDERELYRERSGFIQSIVEADAKDMRFAGGLRAIFADKVRKQHCQPNPGGTEQIFPFYENETRNSDIENDFQFYLNHKRRIDNRKGGRSIS